MPSGFDRLVEKRRKPPRDHVPPHLIPGYGDAFITGGMKNYYDTHPSDGAPRPRYGAQNAPYNKNDRFKRKHPYKTPHGDFNRPHRPRLD